MMRTYGKALVLILATVALMTGATAAQDLDTLAKASPEQRANVQTEFMAKRLSLSTDQRTKVAAINLAYAQKAQPILTGSEGTLRKMHALRDLESKKDAELKAVLTPQQFQTLQSSRDDLRKHLMQALSAPVPQ
jgi:Spy/CpxP family protein refolding chaperone